MMTATQHTSAAGLTTFESPHAVRFTLPPWLSEEERRAVREATDEHVRRELELRAWLSTLDGMSAEELDHVAAMMVAHAMPLARRIWARIDDEVRARIGADGAGQ